MKGLFLHSTGAVSYTHLDVYKRQVQLCQAEWVVEEAGQCEVLNNYTPQWLALIFVLTFVTLCNMVTTKLEQKPIWKSINCSDEIFTVAFKFIHVLLLLVLLFF